MRVMTYNTLFAGFDGVDDRRRHDQFRVITEVDPDVLLLQEAKGYLAGGAALLYDTERALSMRGFVAEAAVTGQNTAIFIKHELTPFAFEPDAVRFHHAAAVLRFAAPGFDRPMTAISVHLCPNGPHVRRREASYLINYADPEALVLVAGDFNSVSPDDPEPEGIDDLPARFRARYVDETGRTERSTLAALKQAGYVDVGSVFGDRTPTVPGAGFTDTEFVPFRSDFILTTSALAERAAGYRVIRTPMADGASDHYPVVVEFRA